MTHFSNLAENIKYVLESQKDTKNKRVRRYSTILVDDGSIHAKIELKFKIDGSSTQLFS